MRRAHALATGALVWFGVVGVGLSQGQEQAPTTIAGSVGYTLNWVEGNFLGVAEAMPAEKYSFIPSQGNFAGVRSFAEQVKHVACTNFAFFNEIEGETPPADCEKGGPDKAAGKAELIAYLKSSFDYGNRVLTPLEGGNAWAGEGDGSA